jgi:hypothetical protein
VTSHSANRASTAEFSRKFKALAISDVDPYQTAILEPEIVARFSMVSEWLALDQFHDLPIGNTQHSLKSCSVFWGKP